MYSLQEERQTWSVPASGLKLSTLPQRPQDKFPTPSQVDRRGFPGPCHIDLLFVNAVLSAFGGLPTSSHHLTLTFPGAPCFSLSFQGPPLSS